MTNIIVAFPKQDNARNIKKILMQNGHHVDAVCSTGAQVLQSAGELGGGIVVCGYRFVDMMYTELHEYLPVQFEMLLVASPANCGNRDVENLVCLATPFQLRSGYKRLLSENNVRSSEKQASPFCFPTDRPFPENDAGN